MLLYLLVSQPPLLYTSSVLICAMDWKSIIYTVIIILLYIPIVFMGANVLFPKYDDYNYYEGKHCYEPAYYPRSEPPTPVQQQAIDACIQKENEERKVYEEAKRKYDSWKYIFILGVNIVTLLVLIAISLLTPIKIGLFSGIAISSFVSTMQYFQSKSIIGLVLVVLVFIGTVFIIQKKVVERSENAEIKKGKK